MRPHLLARLAILPGFGWLLALFVAPFLMLFVISVASTDIVGRPLYGWHPDSYQIIADGNYGSVFARSLGYAGATTVICLLLGYAVAYTIARHGGRHRSLLILAVLVPWFVDYLIRIYSWIQLVGNGGILTRVLNAIGLTGSTDLLGHSGTVIAGLVYNFLPYMILTLYLSIDQLDPRLIEAGRDLYASPATTLLRVTIPCTVPGIISGSLLVFLPSVGDFATAEFLGSPPQTMIGNIITTQVQTPGALPVAAALTVLLVTVLATLAVAAIVASIPLRRKLGMTLA